MWKQQMYSLLIACLVSQLISSALSEGPPIDTSDDAAEEQDERLQNPQCQYRPYSGDKEPKHIDFIFVLDHNQRSYKARRIRFLYKAISCEIPMHANYHLALARINDEEVDLSEYVQSDAFPEILFSQSDFGDSTGHTVCQKFHLTLTTLREELEQSSDRRVHIVMPTEGEEEDGCSVKKAFDDFFRDSANREQLHFDGILFNSRNGSNNGKKPKGIRVSVDAYYLIDLNQSSMTESRQVSVIRRSRQLLRQYQPWIKDALSLKDPKEDENGTEETTKPQGSSRMEGRATEFNNSFDTSSSSPIPYLNTSSTHNQSSTEDSGGGTSLSPTITEKDTTSRSSSESTWASSVSSSPSTVHSSSSTINMTDQHTDVNTNSSSNTVSTSSSSSSFTPTFDTSTSSLSANATSFSTSFSTPLDTSSAIPSSHSPSSARTNLSTTEPNRSTESSTMQSSQPLISLPFKASKNVPPTPSPITTTTSPLLLTGARNYKDWLKHYWILVVLCAILILLLLLICCGLCILCYCYFKNDKEKLTRSSSTTSLRQKKAASRKPLLSKKRSAEESRTAKSIMQTALESDPLHTPVEARYTPIDAATEAERKEETRRPHKSHKEENLLPEKPEPLMLD